MSAWPRGRRSRRAGVFIGLVGPDGSGKTTVAVEIQRRCESGGRAFSYVHWRPSLTAPFRQPAPDATPLPKNAPREDVGALDRLFSLVRLLRSALTFNVAYAWRIRPRLRSGAVVVVDRWIYNYISQPASVRYYASPRIATFVCCRLVVHPRPLFVLDAPPDVILGRSHELTEDEVRSEYARFHGGLRLPDVRWVDATSDPVEIASTIVAQCGLDHDQAD